MRSCRFLLLVLGVAILLSACTTARPSQICSAPSSDRANTVAGASVAASRPADGTIDILLLSGGGFWGAYGAGFLNGWSSRAEALGGVRPDFDVVTGVSTGAIMAPFALLGSRYDHTLRTAYDGVAGTNLIPRQFLLRIIRSNSFSDTKLLRKQLEAALDDQTIDDISVVGRSGRMLLAGATNFDNGNFAVFDLTAIAANQPKSTARTQIADRILASSAFPLLLPPQFIDGCMYMDGSVKQNLFLPEEAVIDSLRQASGSAKVRIFAILNGPATLDQRIIENNLLTVLSRGAELAVEQGQLASLRSIFDLSRDRGFEFHWTSADLEGSDRLRKACGPPPNPLRDFGADFTRCLFAIGEKTARLGGKPWRSDRP